MYTPPPVPLWAYMPKNFLILAWWFQESKDICWLKVEGPPPLKNYYYVRAPGAHMYNVLIFLSLSLSSLTICLGL